MLRLLHERPVMPREARDQGLALLKDPDQFVLYDPRHYTDGLDAVMGRKNRPRAPGVVRDAVKRVFEDRMGIVGYVSLTQGGSCGGAMNVEFTAARPGYGPFMYDVAMSAAKKGIMPDRKFVSALATKVWDRYARRPDVVATPLSKFGGCPTHDDPERPQIDYSYRATRVPGQVTLTDRHIDLMQSVRGMLRAEGLQPPDDLDDVIENALVIAAGRFFNKAFDSRGTDR